MAIDLLIKYFSGFTKKQEEQFRALEEVYQDWNEKINVISRKDIGSLYENHVLHSLSIAAVFDFPPGTEIIDIGTGGGFPGLPLAIFFPEVQFHLVDSINKKLKVVEAVKEATGLTNVTTAHTRVEEIKNRQFDFCVSRAVAPLADLWRWSKPLLRKKGFTVRDEGGVHMFQSGLVCLKGGDLSAEIEETGVQPHVISISDLFEEEYFEEKWLVYVEKTNNE